MKRTDSVWTVQEVPPGATIPTAPDNAVRVKRRPDDVSAATVEQIAPVSFVTDTAEAVSSLEEGTNPHLDRGPTSVQSRQDLPTFKSTTALPKTNMIYEKEWTTFKAFVKKETGSDDPFLTSCTDDEKASLVALMMMRRHEAG